MKLTSQPIVGFALLSTIALTSIGPQDSKPPRFQSQQGADKGSIGGLDKRRSDAVREATRKGLQYLADHQSADGSWAADVGFKVNANYSSTKSNVAHVGITALAIMAFLAQGHVPRRGKYGKAVAKAVDYLVMASNENGYLSDNGTKMYSHAFATLALAEVYGMTRSKEVRKTLQRSIDLICQCQNREGGWRYKPFAQESDMSITVCQVMALRAARNSGIYVQKNVIRDAVDYVRSSDNRNSRRRGGRQWAWRNMDDGVFKYQMRRNARASFSLTAAGVTTLYGAGIYKDALLSRGLNYMRENLREFNATWKGHYFFYYGNYYAVQAFYYAGGKLWNEYYRQMSRVLLDFQNTDGSWPNHTGPGTNFSTAVATLILSIPYQYLPIFQR
jgi:Squalene-hopene cyclase C-terminal domain/Prenyltransferase and squalene oxidase repeat